jgi:beta-glucosidase/6-phospho-beta-glucosidase/beta-galactosidase
VPLTGYFHDTGIDGYEWTLGFGAPRGLVGRDRNPKPSGRWFQGFLGGGGDG